MPTVLDAAQLTRSFGPNRGLFGVDLQVTRGEIFCLLGPNGAGKTSLVRALTGRLALEGGSVAVEGRDPARDPATRRSLGLVPQEIALYPELTVLENLEILGRLAGLSVPESRTRARAALEWVDLTDRARSLVRHLSGGQQRRINLAAGTLHQPAFLILDEPTVGVDAEARERIHGLLADLRRGGTAILLATHDFEEAAGLADRIGIMVEGSLRARGTLSELVTRFFGERSEVLITTARTPTEAGRARLSAAGLVSGRDDRRWSGPLAGGVGMLPGLVASLTDAGIDIVASAVRSPDLASVFRRATGQEPFE